ncbi:hypothetical protein, partial [Streptomyces griseochromogenes]|uniref:hypothetical protein n=1 Tax=Streptomyces griseochromogenes TaxID=68214 RepID=UPI0037A9D065
MVADVPPWLPRLLPSGPSGVSAVFRPCTGPDQLMRVIVTGSSIQLTMVVRREFVRRCIHALPQTSIRIEDVAIRREIDSVPVSVDIRNGILRNPARRFRQPILLRKI